MSLRAGLSFCLVSALAACGASAPTDSEIWHAAALRPGVALAATPGEEQVLSRIGLLPTDEPVRLGDQIFTPGAPYHAASGRICRALGVHSGDDARNRLVCNDTEGRWVFVPDPFPTTGTP